MPAMYLLATCAPCIMAAAIQAAAPRTATTLIGGALARVRRCRRRTHHGPHRQVCAAQIQDIQPRTGDCMGEHHDRHPVRGYAGRTPWQNGWNGWSAAATTRHVAFCMCFDVLIRVTVGSAEQSCCVQCLALCVELEHLVAVQAPVNWATRPRRRLSSPCAPASRLAARTSCDGTAPDLLCFPWPTLALSPVLLAFTACRICFRCGRPLLQPLAPSEPPQRRRGPPVDARLPPVLLWFPL